MGTRGSFLGGKGAGAGSYSYVFMAWCIINYSTGTALSYVYILVYYNLIFSILETRRMITAFEQNRRQEEEEEEEEHVSLNHV
jgi:hypothetical protein